VAECQVLEERQTRFLLQRRLKPSRQQQDERDQPGPGFLFGRAEPSGLVGGGHGGTLLGVDDFTLEVKPC
jgi:hypothetical protein